MNFMDRDGEVRKFGEDLPHWQQGMAMQFVTFRLGDALPLSLMREWRVERDRWMVEHPKPWTDEVREEYHRRFSAKIEAWLDRGMGSCLFAETEARKVLEDCLMRFDGERVRHQAWVIMPNHVHVLFCPLVPMEKLIQGWKGHSARLLGKGSIWQSNYRDTLIRDAGHFANVVRYIRRNPGKAKLGEGMYTLWEREGWVDGQDVHQPQRSG